MRSPCSAWPGLGLAHNGWSELVIFSGMEWPCYNPNRRALCQTWAYFWPQLIRLGGGVTTWRVSYLYSDSRVRAVSLQSSTCKTVSPGCKCGREWARVDTRPGHADWARAFTGYRCAGTELPARVFSKRGPYRPGKKL